jgi:drug/metabolite transporter (DMT)-like permease
MDFERHEINSTLLFYCLVYTIAAADEYWVLDWMRELYGIQLAVYAALLQNASWPVQVFYLRKEWRNHAASTGSERVITSSMYQSYFILGLLSAFITLSRTVGITELPASIYVICANTEIVFETLMTKLILRRKVSWLQLLSVAFVCAGVLISLYDEQSNTFARSDKVSASSLLKGVIMSLASRLASSLNTVLADRYLAPDGPRCPGA